MKVVALKAVFNFKGTASLRTGKLSLASRVIVSCVMESFVIVSCIMESFV